MDGKGKTMTDKKPITYKDAGVDIDAGKKTVELITDHVNSTHSHKVLGGVGAFGGLFDISEIAKEYKNPVLVQSIDGVGTKLMVATMVGDHTTVGIDIVNHGCDDILCQGAKPITFLDYVAMSKLNVNQMEEIVAGMAIACRQAGVALLGGETAELPGTYRDNEYDLAGIMTGVVEKDKIVDGKSIADGHALIGLASGGLHTNGYTLARKVFFDVAGLSVDDVPTGFTDNVGKTLLAPHINYTSAVLKFIEIEKVHGMAHITGGGMGENLVRILPHGTKAEIHRGAWASLPVFDFIQKHGNVSQKEMEWAFNMGIGFILVVEESAVKRAVDFFNSSGHPAFHIGSIVSGEKSVVLS